MARGKLGQLDNEDNLNGVGSHMAEQLYNDRAIERAIVAEAADLTKDLDEALYDNKVVFDYAFGSGDDEFAVDVNDDANSLLRDHAQWSQDAFVELKIDAGAGNDLVFLDVDGTVDDSTLATFQTVDRVLSASLHENR